MGDRTDISGRYQQHAHGTKHTSKYKTLHLINPHQVIAHLIFA